MDGFRGIANVSGVGGFGSVEAEGVMCLGVVVMKIGELWRSVDRSGGIAVAVGGTSTFNLADIVSAWSRWLRGKVMS